MAKPTKAIRWWLLKLLLRNHTFEYFVKGIAKEHISVYVDGKAVAKKDEWVHVGIVFHKL